MLEGKKERFKKERFLTADSIYTTKTKNLFKIKGLCKASMKKGLRKVFASINRATSMVSSANCRFSTGKSGYCNHVIALLLQFADYSLRGFKNVVQVNLINLYKSSKTMGNPWYQRLAKSTIDVNYHQKTNRWTRNQQ